VDFYLVYDVYPNLILFSGLTFFLSVAGGLSDWSVTGSAFI